ncbi:hypothetical phage protein [Bacillus sp. OxB-1]|uniref:hypothetical protein n=1 Tax=Bacillus sp. (strain OxB-1) TaxID=98228 RepID=UPI000581DC7A|nr:hypothetical protein [Bacillus sp. OxB-1]BAQ11304.1 hypothetical phage protein [Bacillus sp. OxB-1]
MAKNDAIKKESKATAIMVAKAINGKTPTFSKAQLLKSAKYVGRRDALSALLKDDKTYTHDQVGQILEKFYKGGSK